MLYLRRTCGRRQRRVSFDSEAYSTWFIREGPVSDELKERRTGRLVVEPVQVARASSPVADVDTARRADALEFIAIQLARINTKLETFLFKLRS